MAGSLGLCFDKTFWIGIIALVLASLFILALVAAKIQFGDLNTAAQSIENPEATKASLASTPPSSVVMSAPVKKMASPKKAIGFRENVCVAPQASINNVRPDMTYDTRFALIDADGRKRYAQILNGHFQVGKARDETHADIVAFARAILKDGKDGRFKRADNSKHGILGYGKREARAYELDPRVATAIGLPPRGSC